MGWSARPTAILHLAAILSPIGEFHAFNLCLLDYLAEVLLQSTLVLYLYTPHVVACCFVYFAFR